METLEESVTSYRSSPWVRSIMKWLQIGEMSKLGWLIGLVKHAIWADSLYFLYLLLLSIPRSQNHHHRRHWQNIPFWALAFLRKFYQICLLNSTIRFSFIWISQQYIFIEQGRHPWVQLPTWGTRSLYLCPPETGCPGIPPGTNFPLLRLLWFAGLHDPWPHGRLLKYRVIRHYCRDLRDL
jgi:hypothetical protein